MKSFLGATMNKNNFAKIIPEEFLKEGATVREGNKEAKLRETTITGLTDPFQIIIDDGRGAFTRFLKFGDNSGGIQKVCDAILFSNDDNALQPIFVELKSSLKEEDDVRLKMKGTDAILHYYLKILKTFYKLDTSMQEPYRVFLYYSDKSRKRNKKVKEGIVLYRCPVTNGGQISLQGIRKS